MDAYQGARDRQRAETAEYLPGVRLGVQRRSETAVKVLRPEARNTQRHVLSKDLAEKMRDESRCKIREYHTS